ncbi:MAG: hypothetical protein COV99_08210 [Bacteroidetes bacterium CG12_big_fil_rev_8_21_14_0_65_60_17]|nr:MAG: hypothetical protein COV99_08210 [Bacteroidetes bacterium CG12_big_fil_rev_8_21_14_0_65_60_17]
MRSAHRIPFAVRLSVSVATLGLFVLRFGYDWGTSDQDEFLPLLLHLSNPDVLATDPFVTMQAADWSVRSAFVWLLHGLSAGVVPPGVVILVVYILSWLSSALAIARIASSFAVSEWAGIVSIPAALLVTMHWAPGGNDVVYSMLVPEMLAWSLGLWAVALLASETPNAPLAGLLSGLATWLHVLAGLQTGGVILFWLLLRRSSLRLAPRFAATWLLISAAPTWLLLSGVGLGSDSTSILTHLRAPHHYLPQYVPSQDWLLFSALLAGGVISLYRFPELIRRRPGRQGLAGLLAAPSILLLSGIVFVTLWPGGPWTPAQPMKLAVLVRVVSVIAISCVAAGLAEGRIEYFIPRFLRVAAHRVHIIAFIVLFAAGCLVAWSDYWKARALPRYSTERVHLYTLFQDVRSHTPPDAVILIPPDWTGFQYASHRAQWVSFKAFPFQADAVIRWKNRLEYIGTPANDLAGLAWRRELAASYRHRSASEWRRVLEKVDATHALLPEGRAPEPTQFCVHGWCLVELSRILSP